jgi:hypothetical protein
MQSNVLYYVATDRPFGFQINDLKYQEMQHNRNEPGDKLLYCYVADNK